MGGSGDRGRVRGESLLLFLARLPTGCLGLLGTSVVSSDAVASSSGLTGRRTPPLTRGATACSCGDRGRMRGEPGPDAPAPAETVAVATPVAATGRWCSATCIVDSGLDGGGDRGRLLRAKRCCICTFDQRKAQGVSMAADRAIQSGTLIK